MQCDPEAAHVVFESGVTLTMAGTRNFEPQNPKSETLNPTPWQVVVMGGAMGQGNTNPVWEGSTTVVYTVVW